MEDLFFSMQNVSRGLRDVIISVENLCKNYSDFCAVKNVSFSIKTGDVIGFLGPNGAGKTTVMNILTGCISCSGGSVKILGCDIFNEPLKFKKNIGYLPENPPLYYNMTVFEYLKFVCGLKGIKNCKEEIDKVFVLCNLLDNKKRLISSLSKGYKQRVGLAQALLGSPKILILDEPTSGLDPAQIVQVRHLIKSLSKNHTVILSTHILSEIQAICGRIIIMNKGVIVADDTEKNILKSNKAEVYFLRVCCSDKDVIFKIFKGFSDFLALEDVEFVAQNIIEFKVVLRYDCENVDFKISNALMQNRIPILKFLSGGNTLEQVFINLIENRQ